MERCEKSKKLNTYITEDFENVLKKADNFDKNPDSKKNYPAFQLQLKIYFVQKI